MTDMEQLKQIQWFPGHMARTRRKIGEVMSQIDAVAELADARAPQSSRNPELDSLAAGKPRLLVLTKSDMADEAATRRWVAAFEKQGIPALAVDCKTGRGMNGFVPLLRQVMAQRLAIWKQKGMTGRPIRVLVAGIPNVGKSSFINRLGRGGKAKVEDRPGVTRQNQWFVAGDGVHLLDTPGVLWPKFEDQTAALYLAFTGAIKDQILDSEELACSLLTVLERDYKDRLADRFKLDETAFSGDSWELLQVIGRKRGMLVSGGEVNTERAATTLLDEYRGGKLGRITLEQPKGEETAC